MRSVIYILLILLVSCQNQNNSTENESPMEQKIKPGVTGIGGIFFKCENPENTRNWYTNNLNLVTNQYGSMFETLSSNKMINYLQWSPFSSKTTYFKPSEKDFMINYRVSDLEGLLTILESNGVTVLDSIDSYEYGKFLHILDNENNKIELWEPVDVVFTNLYSGQTTINTNVSSIQFRAKNPEKLRNWYKKNLGFETTSEGVFFSYINSNKIDKIEKLHWQPIEESSSNLPQDQQLLIGYKVNNLDSLLLKIQKNDPQIIVSNNTKENNSSIIDIDNQMILLEDNN